MNKIKYISVLLMCLFFVSFNSITLNSSQWFTDIDEAQRISEQTGRPILALFTCSDANDWCKKLYSEVFITPEFKDWADKKVILLEIDFPKIKNQSEKVKLQNKELIQIFQVKEFPTICILTIKKDQSNKKTLVNPIFQRGYVDGGCKKTILLLDQMISTHQSNKILIKD